MIGDLFGGLFGCGIAGGCGPTCPDGAAAQAASRQQYIIRTYLDPATQMERREYWQAGLAVSSEELRLQAMRGSQNAWPMSIGAEATTHLTYSAPNLDSSEGFHELFDWAREPNWWFWWWLTGLAAVAIAWRHLAL